MPIQRLNYIGSKFQLLEWLETNIKEKTGWTDFQGKRIGDLFAGTGVVTYHFRNKGAVTFTNDAELYSSIIAAAFAFSVYSDKCKQFMTRMSLDIQARRHDAVTGYIQKHYSPSEGCERMFFTVENAKRIDYIRKELDMDDDLSPQDFKFLLASLLLSADAVSNVPAVYGCYLKNFKAKALKELVLQPIHEMTTLAQPGSTIFHSDVLSPDLLEKVVCDAVYLDPPYNERQYSKNYFPLNMIAKTPGDQAAAAPLTGKTGIPTDCFISPFCKKGEVKAAFQKLVAGLKTEWVFLSYSSESLISKDDMINLLKAYGEVSVVERDYKRFKSYEYNEDKAILEYLFCLKKVKARRVIKLKKAPPAPETTRETPSGDS
jgi:adenine-specific DNA-methyltransferase